ncbi:MAG: cytochrome c oxidase assembly protein [Acidobacteriia bacterium]|nr:cytochrome c oxidase assembly protein [Terriglobia bacterium]
MTLEWEFDAGIVVPLAASALLYARGARRVRGTSRRQMASFWAGWITLTLALVSPLHALGEQLFSAHMVQHEILMLISAPLLVLSRPLVPMLWAFPFAWRRALGQSAKSPMIARTWDALTLPLAAWCIHAAALWVWHAPALFQATLASDSAHAAQHASFLGSALLFWWSLFYTHGRLGYGASVLYVFTTAMHTSILGVLLTFAPSLWYPAYAGRTAAWGLTPLEDQQLGGLVMWVPAGIVYLALGLYFFAQWLRESDTSEPRPSGSGPVRILPPLAVLVFMLIGCNAGARQNAIAVTGGDPVRGHAAILKYGCGSCHAIAGVSGATGLVGPSLTGIGNRMYVAGVLRNTPENIVRWIRNPKQVDEKTAMPALGVTPQDAIDIAAYLYSTK